MLGLFANSNLVKAFSAAGLSAFLNFDYGHSAITYIFCLSTFMFFYLIYWVWNEDLIFIVKSKESKYHQIHLEDVKEFLSKNIFNTLQALFIIIRLYYNMKIILYDNFTFTY